MIRWRNISTIEYGRFNDALQICHELNDIARAHVRAEARLLVPSAGVNNQLIAEIEFPDYATYQSEMEANFRDRDYMKCMRRLAEITYPQSSHSELLEDAPAVIA